MVVLYRLAALDLPRRRAERAVLLTAIFPFSFFFGAVYTESTFLLFTLLSFYGFRTRRWALGGVAGAVATATRVTGIMMWPALAWIAWRSAKPTGRDRASRPGALIVATLGFAGYCAYIYSLTGDPLLWATALTRWGSGYHPGGAPWTAPVDLVHRLLTHPYAFLASEPMALYDTLYGVTALLFAAAIPFVWRRFGAGLRPVHAAEPVRAALVGRVRGAGPLLLGAVSGVHLARRRSGRASFTPRSSSCSRCSTRSASRCSRRSIRSFRRPLALSAGSRHGSMLNHRARRHRLPSPLLTLSACAKPPVKPAAAAPPPPTPAQRLASADALVREGCLDCLIDAFGQYELLRTIPSAAEVGTAGAVRSAALIALRQRELGMTDEGYGQRARSLLAGRPVSPRGCARCSTSSTCCRSAA